MTINPDTTTPTAYAEPAPSERESQSGAPRLVDIGSASPTEAAFIYAANGIPVAPFDPTTGKGKDCGNILGSTAFGLKPWYQHVTTDPNVLDEWLCRIGEFVALATSPGAFGAAVLDVDYPENVPPQWRPLLRDDTVPYVSTRPKTLRRGHYFWSLPPRVQIGNPTVYSPERKKIGEFRCLSGGIVLPPYGDRKVLREGHLPILPEVLRTVGGGRGGGVSSTNANSPTVKTSDVNAFCAKHTRWNNPAKLNGLVRLYSYRLSNGQPPHDAMRGALLQGLREARNGDIPARSVLDALHKLWPKARSDSEFRLLCRWAVTTVTADAA